jgi:hypothetical protein
MKNFHSHQATLPLFLFLACGISACGGSGGDDDGAGATGGSAGSSAGTGGATAGTGGSSAGSAGSSAGSGGTAGTSACGANVTAAAVNNYSFSSTLTFPPVSVMPDSDLTFDWSAVTEDFLGHEVDPMADVDQVSVIMWSLPLDELQTKLNNETLAQRDTTTVPVTLFTEKMATSGNLLEFTLAGNPVVPEEVMPYFSATEYPPADHTYTVMVATGTTLGKGTRMIQSFKLDPASTNTTVTVTDTSTALEYTVDLDALTPTQVPAATGAITVDWSGMTVNALGNEFQTTDITRVMLGRYTETVAELEASFLDLELIAEDLYRVDVPSGTSIDLSGAMTEAGQAFAGIDANSTWVLTLICGDCNNPAPWYLTVLKPCE